MEIGIVMLVETKEVVPTDGIKILFFGKTATGVVWAIDGCTKQTTCHNVPPITIHKILATIGCTDSLKPFLGESGTAQHIMHQTESLGSMTTQGIEGDEAMMDRYRQLHPCTQPVKTFRQSRSRKMDSTLAQQTVGEKGLQQAVLLA